MADCCDFLEPLGPDASTRVFTLLDDPADLVRATAVSRSWRRFVIENGFSKSLCTRKFPEVLNFSSVSEVSDSSKNAQVGSSSAFEWANLQKEHRVYAMLCHSIISPDNKGDCIYTPVYASSTDNYPDEGIENTLEPDEAVDGMPSYWSSGGQSDPGVSEFLIYSLTGNLVVVNEIKIQPFEAFFQPGHPIYSAKFVRFRMGASQWIQDGYAEHQLATDDNYHWTYVSPEFPMTQENVLQSFKLPRPVCCIGGILQIELIGRVQRQAADGLFYICVCHVQVVGTPLQPSFDVDIEASSSGTMALKYFPESYESFTHKRGGTTSTEDPVRAFINFGSDRGLNHPFLGTLLRALHSSDEEDYVDDSDDNFY
ncbi:F-box protein [Canna indica]|uniref:F-box protein n=1 Tax=Canna indica TaxID=4628 RepID=A0AAQ3QEC7_9LILI|nr:F-box protein [Canna indica]